ncbi:MAG: PAQR family membrane homeostasis protein TrhA [Chitinophagales bacterium]
MKTPNYSSFEERLHYLTHGIGAIVSVIGFIVLIYYALEYQDTGVMAGFIVFGLCMIVVFTFSAIYHWVEHKEWKKTLRVLDHIAIFLMIAGTYTPYLLGNLRENWGIPLLIVVWSLAIGGMIFKWVIRHQLQKYEAYSIAFYAGLGMMILFFIQPVVETVDFWGVFLLMLGGAFYLIGIVFYANNRIPYNHAIWHLFVIAGAASHYFSILYYVRPPMI